MLDVVIGLQPAAEDALRKAGKTVPSPVALKLMVDTGAESTVIPPGIASQLGAQPVGVLNMTTPTSTRPCPIFAIRIILSTNVIIDAQVAEAPMQGAGQSYGLMGRDVLAFAVLTYLGPTETFSISF